MLIILEAVVNIIKSPDEIAYSSNPLQQAHKTANQPATNQMGFLTNALIKMFLSNNLGILGHKKNDLVFNELNREYFFTCLCT